MTYADLFSRPEGEKHEIYGGELVITQSPLPRHSKTQGALRRFVGGPYDDDHGFGGPGGWWIFIEVDIELSAHDVVRPDMSGWLRERLPNPGEVRPIRVSPDWVCEVLSPSTTKYDRGIKRSLYHEHGAGHYWIVDPEARLVEVFVRGDETWSLHGTFDESMAVALPPFLEVELPIARLFLPKEVSSE